MLQAGGQFIAAQRAETRVSGQAHKWTSYIHSVMVSHLPTQLAGRTHRR